LACGCHAAYPFSSGQDADVVADLAARIDGVTVGDLPTDGVGQDLSRPDGNPPDTTLQDTAAQDTAAQDTAARDTTPDTSPQDITPVDLPHDASQDLRQDGAATVTISGTVDLSASCSSNPDSDCQGVLYVGAYTAPIPPFEPNNYVAHWDSGVSVDMQNAAPVAFEIKGLPPNATYTIWPFLAENPAMYVVSDPNDDDLTPVFGVEVVVGAEDVGGVTVTLNWRWIGG
jgi:hypothetical protein